MTTDAPEQPRVTTGLQSADAKPALEVAACICEYLHNPLGIDVPRPRLTWRLGSVVPGQHQSAYQVLAASTQVVLAQDHGDLWDSGKVASADSAHVRYDGLALAAGQRCWWKVRVWDGLNVPSAWSSDAWWEMGLLNAADWRAEWIAPPDRGQAAARVSPLFRRVRTGQAGGAGTALRLWSGCV